MSDIVGPCVRQSATSEDCGRTGQRGVKDVGKIIRSAEQYYFIFWTKVLFYNGGGNGRNLDRGRAESDVGWERLEVIGHVSLIRS